ncbi:MAG: Fic family protein [Akkermansia sp.]
MRITHPPALSTLMESALSDGCDLFFIMESARAESKRVDRYLSWNELRFRKAPAGLTEQQWWLGLKLQRRLGREYLGLTDAQHKAFSYSLTPCMLKLLHEIDTLGASCEPSPELKRSGHNYLINRLEQESITSSMLEGAVTTRAQAKAMLRQNRKPLDMGERMVLNNYATMQEIGNIKHDAFSVEQILTLHRMLTLDTLDEAQMAGSFRRDEDKVRVEDVRTGELVHTPPPAEYLPSRLQALCDFANQGDEDYTHPIIRACIIHFWLAYDHPFIDGNGRTARALFYWYMLQSGYPQYEYISISSEILKRPKNYYKSFLDTEEDEGDINYFIFQQLCTIKSAIESLQSYISNKSREQEDKLAQLSALPELNMRQKSIYAELLKRPETELSVPYVTRQYHTSPQTARNDLQRLDQLGLIIKTQRGKTFFYHIA